MEIPSARSTSSISLSFISSAIYQPPYEFVGSTSPSHPTAPARFTVNTDPTPGFKRLQPLNRLFKFYPPVTLRKQMAEYSMWFFFFQHKMIKHTFLEEFYEGYKFLVNKEKRYFWLIRTLSVLKNYNFVFSFLFFLINYSGPTYKLFISIRSNLRYMCSIGLQVAQTAT